MWSFPKDRDCSRFFFRGKHLIAPGPINQKTQPFSTLTPPMYGHSASGTAMLPSACW